VTVKQQIRPPGVPAARSGSASAGRTSQRAANDLTAQLAVHAAALAELIEEARRSVRDARTPGRRDEQLASIEEALSSIAGSAAHLTNLAIIANARTQTAQEALASHGVARRSRRGRRCPLSSREVEVLGRLAEGKVYKQIAFELGVSTSTIRSHLHHIYAKLGTVDRAQAVLLATRHGWL
jgi:DNA-binding NarL/FixJ family response regulator